MLHWFFVVAFLNCAAQAREIELVLKDGHDGFYGTRDTAISVDPGLAGRSLGGESTIWIWQFDGVSLIKFDFDYSVIPTEAIVTEATLELYCTSVGFSKEEVERPWDVGVYDFLADWREGSGDAKSDLRDGATLRTWNGRDGWPKRSPIAHAGKLLGTTTLRGPEPRWYKWSLDAALVRSWIASQRPNYGFLLWGKPPGKAVSFASREGETVGHRPRLRLRLANASNIDGELNAQRVDARKLPNDRLRRRRPTGLGVTREQVVAMLQTIDPKVKLERSPPVLGTPLYVGNGLSLNVNIAGASEDVVEVSVMFDASNGEPRDWVRNAALRGLLSLLQPDWTGAVDWLVTNMPNAKRQPFMQITTERGGVVTRVESVGNDLIVGIETKGWRQCKAPE